jgi:IS30 family transposase
LTDDMVIDAVTAINNRPRKSLGWVSPSELLSSYSVALGY